MHCIVPFSFTKWCLKGWSLSWFDPVNTCFLQHVHIKHTHFLPEKHTSKHILKSLRKYEILSICISFFFLFTFWDARNHTKLLWKPNEPFRCSVALQRSFQNNRLLISANDCCVSLKLNAQTQEETLGAEGERHDEQMSNPWSHLCSYTFHHVKYIQCCDWVERNSVPSWERRQSWLIFVNSSRIVMFTRWKIWWNIRETCFLFKQCWSMIF